MKTIKSIPFSALVADLTKNVRFSDNYGDIVELAENIQAKGLLVPLMVEKQGDNYSIISGHRRYAALLSLVQQGIIKPDYPVNCSIVTVYSEVERAALKLLTNDGQPITPDEWAAEIGRVADEIKKSDPNFIKTIAERLGKREQYVQTMYTTWTKLSKENKKQIKEGKIGMTLASLIATQVASHEIVNIMVSEASKVKQEVKNTLGKVVDDNTIAKAAVQTVNESITKAVTAKNEADEAVKKAATPEQKKEAQAKVEAAKTIVTKETIGADLMENIKANLAAKSAAKNAAKSVKQTGMTLQTYISTLAAYLDGDKKVFLNLIVNNYTNGVSPEELAQVLKAASKAA